MFFTMDSAGFGRGMGRGFTFDRATFDSTGVFFQGQLERLDLTMHEPLVNITYPRDIDLREDVTFADETSSYTVTGYAAPGGISPTGKAWASKEADSITGISVNIGKIVNPLTEWSMEVKYTIREMEQAMQLGRPIDQQKYAGMLMRHQMDTDAMVYVGDTEIGYQGLVNDLGTAQRPAVYAASVLPGGAGFTQWSTKTPQEILNDVNGLTVQVWQNSALAIFPAELRVPPAQMALLTQPMSTQSNVSILQYIMANSLANQHNGKPLNIQAVKWLVGAGVGGTLGVPGTVDRMVAYTRDLNKIRFPMTLMQRTPIEYRGRWITTTYFHTLGVCEFVYGDTVGYNDGV